MTSNINFYSRGKDAFLGCMLISRQGLSSVWASRWRRMRLWSGLPAGGLPRGTRDRSWWGMLWLVPSQTLGHSSERALGH